MHSLRGWKWLVLGSVVGSVSSAVMPTPAITPAPRSAEVNLRSLEKRETPDAVSLAHVLLTALPLSLRLIAATNVPAVSSILWEEFLDDKKPQWFSELPWDIQNYLIREFGPQSAWPTASPTSKVTATGASSTAQTSLSQSSESPTPSASDSASTTSTPSTSTPVSSSVSSPSLASTLSQSRATQSSASPSTVPVAPESSNSGLTRRQKVGLGVGVPFAFLGIAAILFACCFLQRRRRRRRIEGFQPPSSPGFIPRYSFQDRTLSSDHYEHRTPLNRASQEDGTMNWEDDGYDPAEMEAPHRANALPPVAAPMAMHDPNPIMAAPALYHTHSSNRARGKRTSYTNLHSVAEVTEPDDEMMESPVLGRNQTPPRQTLRRMSAPLHMDMPPIPAVATLKRKPVPTSPMGTSPAAEAASRSLLRPPLAQPNHSGSSSSGMAVSSVSTSSSLGNHSDDVSSPISPVSSHAPKNPFAGGYDYLEDYGPEYSNNGYDDLEGGLYGGHRSLDRYPDPSAPRKSSKTEWPLRNMMGSGHKRNRSPMWDRVYE
ncbi:uncharacterized protein K460DRAFT_373749 [Cucurbitaria berberidis CBS 394.84]|uniref:Mid2 domain-containing protein n=1 Tax=Cucurbitaria berberidis CBS 394.84 TaxID=1168544 RepID=A0A9P4GUL5_9PLEO|nr:uncharacterized protein K460DRAFT_373749 [Cucurbitaria berberidis CBS 394.84]KAF1851836.1 hypothetical protein K460DRAFT_373749 [Cucurbitaria berberidis CBS 394.84]